MQKKSLTLLALLSCLGGLTQASPLGFAFTYQGRLTDGTNLANGQYDLRFVLQNDGGTAVASPLTNAPVPVSNGLFIVLLDFGSGAFNGDARWLQIGVRTNGSANPYTLLTPRQAITPEPYALWTFQAGSVTNGAITTAALADYAITSNKIAPASIAFANLAQNGATNGQVIKWSEAGHKWLPDQDEGAGTALLGYKEFGRFVIPPAATGSNAIAQGEHAQALGQNSVVGGGLDNLASHVFSTVGGGWSNSAGGFLFGRSTVAGGDWNQALSDWSTIGGGQQNTAVGFPFGRSTVAGGWLNDASADFAGIGGGSHNTVLGGHGVIAGGQSNIITTTQAPCSVIGGGLSNLVSGMTATIPGGAFNEATDIATFAAGRRAKSRHGGAFVWADGVDEDFASTTANQFAVRATGGTYLVTPEVRLWSPWGGQLRLGRLVALWRQ